jgi:hypothetical protein
VVELRTQIEQGTYRVDPAAVADAVVRRLLALAAASVARRTGDDPLQRG